MKFKLFVITFFILSSTSSIFAETRIKLGDASKNKPTQSSVYGHGESDDKYDAESMARNNARAKAMNTCQGKGKRTGISGAERVSAKEKNGYWKVTMKQKYSCI